MHHRAGQVRALATACGPVLLHAFVNVHPAFLVAVLAPLVLCGTLGFLTRARPRPRAVFLQRLVAGLFAGCLAVLAGDALRWLILISGTVPFNPFRAVEVFGLLALRADADTAFTKTIGWMFHIWSGVTFAAMYTLALGRGRLAWAIAWSLALQAAMLASYPSWFRITLDAPFILVALLVNLGYGVALGLAARGAVRE